MGRKSREKWSRRAEAAEQARALAEQRRRLKEAALQGAAEGRRRGCLLCRQCDRDFTSREHIIPESLGNTELVLPPGVVCDRCNHSVCSPLDAALTDFAPIAMMRTIHAVPSKKGKMPSVKFDNGSLEAKAPGQLLLRLDSKRWRTPDLHREDGSVQWGFTGQRHDTSPKRLSLVHRALVKMALECAWLDHGEEVALSADFDRERAIVLSGKHDGYVVATKHQVPDTELSLYFTRQQRRSDGEPLVTMAAKFWGFMLLTDTLFPEPQWAVPDELAVTLPFRRV